MAGLSMAAALAHTDFDIAVIESTDLKKVTSKTFDGRVSAITKHSKDVFLHCGVWKLMEPNAQPIFDIRITEAKSLIFLDYEHDLIGDEPMGYIIENRFIREAMLKHISAFKNIKIISPAKVKSIQYDSNYTTVELDNDKKIQAKLVVAADGKNSKIAKQAGIKTFFTDYNQDGIVCTVKHEKNHNAEARERFLPTGPFAILPMIGGFHSSLVWVEKRELASKYMNLNNEDFTEQVKNRIGDYLGKIEVVEPRFSYPLSLSFAKTYYSKRLALIGDAAHAIHPVAGQGFNLGIRDVAILAELLEENADLGLDIGNDNLLEAYQRRVRPDNFLMMAVTDGITRLFSNNVIPIKVARNLGVAAVNRMSTVKKFLMKHAMGEWGYQPKLKKKG